jgi:dTDP-4-amino-4,6-dideoxygalactose transaminase
MSRRHGPAFNEVPIPFWRTSLAPGAAAAVLDALNSDHHAGNGEKTAQCHAILGELYPQSRPLITHSGTAALEMAALLLELTTGDEVIMPSWTFPSTANAVVLRGATPVFIDCRADNLNIDVAQIEQAITPRTRAIFCVHYAGVGCYMAALMDICERRKLYLVEDAAQAIGASWGGRPLGSFGAFGILSFHASKNIAAGEAGALLINDPSFVERAEMIWEKGTDRVRFSRDEVAFYRWQTVGSSFLPSELTAALLAAQLGSLSSVTQRRLAAWTYYHQNFSQMSCRQRIKLPEIAKGALHNGHVYHIRLESSEIRDQLQQYLRQKNIESTQHYQPLHSAPAGIQFGRAHGELMVTTTAARTLLRLPLDAVINDKEQDRVLACVESFLDKF